MKKEKKVHRIDYLPKEYTFAIIKTYRLRNSQIFIMSIANKDVGSQQLDEHYFDYKIILPEFKKHFYVNSLDNVEEVILAQIAIELQAIRDINPIKTPIPTRMPDEYNGKSSLTINPELHKYLHVDSFDTEEIINELIETKLKPE